MNMAYVNGDESTIDISPSTKVWREERMKLIRKNNALARNSFGVFFEADEKLLDAGDLDFYLFNREARMDKVWRSERAGEERRKVRLGYWESGRGAKSMLLVNGWACNNTTLAWHKLWVQDTSRLWKFPTR